MRALSGANRNQALQISRPESTECMPKTVPNAVCAATLKHLLHFQGTCEQTHLALSQSCWLQQL